MGGGSSCNWDLLRLPAETRFPVPGTGAVQIIAAYLLTRLPTMAARDHYDTRFALTMAADWLDLDDGGRDLVFQRLNLYAIVASYSWPTAIASSSAVTSAPANLLLPPRVVPVQRANNQRLRRQHDPQR